MAFRLLLCDPPLLRQSFPLIPLMTVMLMMCTIMVDVFLRERCCHGLTSCFFGMHDLLIQRAWVQGSVYLAIVFPFDEELGVSLVHDSTFEFQSL